MTELNVGNNKSRLPNPQYSGNVTTDDSMVIIERLIYQNVKMSFVELYIPSAN